MARKAQFNGDSRTVRRMSRHLPRIASGDAPDDWEENKEDQKPSPEPADDWRSRATPRERRLSETWSPATEKRRPRAPSMPSPHDPNDVVGIPGRIRLSRDQSTLESPAPSTTRFTRGLWADVNRHLLQAYEYLCHVGEAQQWIEGCLGYELGFGVVEMDEGLRNGAVLAKLVRVFQGEHAVPRVWEVRTLLSVLLCLRADVSQDAVSRLAAFG